MDMKDYEKQAEELKRQALVLEASMNTLKALEECAHVGHDWILRLRGSEFETVDSVELYCNRCKAETSHGSARVYLPDFGVGKDVFGDLAGKDLKDIPIEKPMAPENEAVSSEPEEDEGPEKQVDNAPGSGTYRVSFGGDSEWMV